ncbi:hypothetical protein CYJ57_01845 [Falseniella ignava]|uniref:Uncharacterized protein n=1 Tax=Falseniella ignava TaxID=137730 RepID=A0A2I1K4A9_9LACT|nr:hypothetical protein [Falseniella ignava]PKY90392.1 hypothetical protein CYJ57_01845 [Falseniella ignava]
MELPIKQGSAFVNAISNYFMGFAAQESHNQSIIMPLREVESQLNRAYVSMEPLSVHFEYYDCTEQIQQAIIDVVVKTPILTNRCIQLERLSDGKSITLLTEQILSVAATTA